MCHSVAELRKNTGRQHRGAEGRPTIKYRDWQPQWGGGEIPLSFANSSTDVIVCRYVLLNCLMYNIVSGQLSLLL